MRAGAIVAMALLWAAPAAADPFTLFDALGAAYETNPQLDAQRAALRATDEEVAKANAGWRPSINASGYAGKESYEIGHLPGSIETKPLQGQVVVSQPIFRGGRTYAEISRAKALVRAGRAQLASTEQLVLLAAVTAYMDVVRDTAILNLRHHNVDVLQKQARATQLQFDAGDLTKTDVAQSQARLSGAQSDLATAEGQLATSRATFEQVIGRAPESLEAEPPPFPQLPGSEDDTLGLAEKQSPTIIAARETEHAADYAIDDAVGALLPQLSVQGELMYSRGTASGFASGAGVLRTKAILAQLVVPIYQGGADEAAVRQSKELHSQAMLNVSTADRLVRQAATSAWNTLQAAQVSITSTESQVKANELAFQGVQKEQAVGGRTILDVLNAQQELLNSQVALASAQRTAQVAAYALLAAVGELDAKTLGLKVELYDPLEHYDDDAAKWFGFD